MSKDQNITRDGSDDQAAATGTEQPETAPEKAREIGGPKEGDPTRYGDWTVKGRCIDF